MNMYLELQMEYSSQRDQFQPDILTRFNPQIFRDYITLEGSIIITCAISVLSNEIKCSIIVIQQEKG